jgi:hypothetical protein
MSTAEYEQEPYIRHAQFVVTQQVDCPYTVFDRLVGAAAQQGLGGVQIPYDVINAIGKARLRAMGYRVADRSAPVDGVLTVWVVWRVLES